MESALARNSRISLDMIHVDASEIQRANHKGREFHDLLMSTRHIP